ncbi:PLD nuclease N-terminal domain-containing protein [Corynebacterium otitidis]|uniref:Cardiolipin synthase N-terminal domain-containing protein n=1 Tax=Corynebacterium otitidis ATCC 51513 TaxID=883169 RepID=K0Z6H7_9CORY|nr:PLD nuclease N-terminal domain-containing protein [Corynebacterium otitidis]EJZ82990.1 hypothetical protein HMPREF9719_00101 [Corynebacterium otitidis ATCC 51513]
MGPAILSALMTLVGLAGLIVAVVAIVSVLRSEVTGGAAKLLWCIGIVVFPIIGAVLWFLLGRRRGTPD